MWIAWLEYQSSVAIPTEEISHTCDLPIHTRARMHARMHAHTHAHTVNAAVPLPTEASTPLPCPFHGSYRFRYDENSGGFCDNEASHIRQCASDAHFRFLFRPCDGVDNSLNKGECSDGSFSACPSFCVFVMCCYKTMYIDKT